MKLIKPTSHLHFVNFLDCLERINPGRELDPVEEQLLNRIVLAASRGEDLLVGDLISLAQIGSQATLHGRIKNLVAMDYIKLKENNSDGRKKFVVPSSKAMKYYEKLSACLEKAIKG